MIQAMNRDVPLVLLLRISKKWREDLTPAELYEVTRGWWVMSGLRTQQVVTVLAVAGSKVREVYEPRRWITPAETGRENRWGFEGAVAHDRDRWVGRDVAAMFPPGSANPVRYVRASSMAPMTSDATSLSERVSPLLQGFEDDLLFAMSRSAQELFHTNTLAWLIDHVPAASEAIMAALGTTATGVPPATWREHQHLDLLIHPGGDELRLVVENKLFSIPSRKQLIGYTAKPLPWCPQPSPLGAARTRYVLLSLMRPGFDPPAPWVHVTYESIADALAESIDDIDGPDAHLVRLYSALLSRLAGIAEVLDPRFDPTEPFLDMAELGPALAHSPFNGPVQKMRYAVLLELVQAELDHVLEFNSSFAHGQALVSYYQPISETRTVGWQLQGSHLRRCMLISDPHLSGQGKEKAAARARVAGEEHADWFDFRFAEHVLGTRAHPPNAGPNTWNHFAPSFICQYRKIDPSVTTVELVAILAEWTRDAISWPKQ